VVLRREIETLFGRALRGETEKESLATPSSPNRAVTSSWWGIGVRRPPHSTAPGRA